MGDFKPGDPVWAPEVVAWRGSDGAVMCVSGALYGASELIPRHAWLPAGTWPTEPGFYWFYGHLYRPAFDSKPRMVSMEVRQVSNGVMYVACGAFIHAEEGAVGRFCCATVPAPPLEDEHAR
jgi:hypothetical protein